MGKPLTEQQFNTIKAQLRKKSNDIAKVAEASGLKVSTIKAVRRMESWKQYQAYRKAEGEKIKALHKLDKITKSQRVQPQVTIKTSPADVQKLKKASAPMKVPKPATTPKPKYTKVSRSSRLDQSEAFDAMGLAMVQLTERIVTLEVAVRKLQHDSIKSDMQERRTFMARFRRGSK